MEDSQQPQQVLLFVRKPAFLVPAAFLKLDALILALTVGRIFRVPFSIATAMALQKHTSPTLLNQHAL